MSLLPLHLIFTVGIAIACFALGIFVWRRGEGKARTGSFALVAISLAMWTLADWMLTFRATVPPLQVFVWKTLLYGSLCLAPSLVIYTVTPGIRRSAVRRLSVLVMLGCVGWGALFFGFILSIEAKIWILGPTFFLHVGSGVALIAYLCAFFLMAIEVYPLLHSASVSVLERRHAAYGLVMFVPVLMAGALQFVTVSIPTVVFMPLFAMWFLVFSVASFVRTVFLDVALRSLEAFFVFVLSFAIVIFLRSQNRTEFIVAGFGSLLIGGFGFIAIHLMYEEWKKRSFLEQKNRQLEQVDEARRDFVDMVSHQLRTPLGGIRASASMLLAGDYGILPEKAHQAVGLILDASTRLALVAETFLNASRLEVGMYQSHRECIEIHPEIEGLVKQMQVAANLKGLTLSLNISSRVPLRMSLDREALSQSLFNVLDNAIKYTQAGEIRVDVDSEHQSLVCRVMDTGPGMNPEEIHQLFQKFHRGHTNHAHAVDGTGLGLFIAKRLVEAAGGTIGVTSPGAGLGVVCRIQLPFSV